MVVDMVLGGAERMRLTASIRAGLSTRERAARWLILAGEADRVGLLERGRGR